MLEDLGIVAGMLGSAKRLSMTAGGPPHIVAGIASAERRVALIKSGAAFYCPAGSLPQLPRGYAPDEYVTVDEDGRVELHDGPVIKRAEAQGAEPPRPPMTVAAGLG
jgi:hypothetical protein